MLAFIEGAETCTRRTVNWHWYDCAGILMLQPRPQHHPLIRDNIWRGRSQNKLKAAWQFCFLWVESSCSLWLVALQHFPDRLASWEHFLAPLPASCTPAHVFIGHPFIRFLQRDFVRPLSGFDSSRVGGAARSPLVADVITLLIGHAADQLPVVFLVGTLKLKMSTTDQCFPVVE